MPVYRITAPDGQSYEVTAPEGATEQDVLSYAQANYASAAPAPEPEQDSAWDFSGDRTIFGRAREFQKAIPRGAASSLGTIGEGLEALTDYLPARKVAEYATEKAAGFLGFGDEYEKGKEAIAAAPEQFTRYINEDSVLKADEKYKDLWTTNLGEGAGSILTIAAASLANPGLGWATAISQGSGQQQQAMRRAEEQGEDISEGERLYGTVFGGAVGALDMVPIGTILKPLKSIPKNIPIADKEKVVGLISRALTSEPVKAGLEEGTQEVVSSVLQNLVEMGYNPNAELPTAESLWNDFSVGAFLGTGARMLSDAAAGHRNTVMGKMELERERKAREREEANFALAGQQLRADAERRAAIDTDPTVFAQEAAARQREAITVPPPSEEEVKAFNSPSVTGAAFTPSSFGELYAYRIIGKLGKFFPTNTTFSVMQKDNGFAVVDANGNQYGQDIPDQRAANAVATNLNREVPESGIRSAILDTLKSSPQAVSEQDFEPMYRYGYRALSPETGRVTFASLNEAAGTTADKGYIENLPLDIAATAKKVRDGRYSIQMPDGSTQYISGLTAAQKLNLKRLKEGLPEATSFNIGEARDFLGGTVGKLAEPVVSGIQDRLQYGASLLDGKPVVFSEAGEVIPGRKTTDAEKLRAGMDEDGKSVLPDYIEFQNLDEAKRYAGRLNQRAPTSRYLPPEILADKTDLTNDIKRLLDAKNITSEVSSPEIGQLVKAFTGAKSFSDMTLDDQKLFYARMRELPKLSKPAKIPVFKARTYTPEQFVRAAQAQNQSGKMLSDTEIAEAAGLEPNAKGVTDIRRELKRQNGKRFVEMRRMAAEVAPVQEALGKILSEYGIDPNILKVSTRLKDEEGLDITDQTEGFYDPRTKELALAIDSIDPEGKLTQEQRVNALAEVMSHEIIHALRAMDMFTQKEWALLEAAATRTQKPGKGMTYLQWARRPVNKGGYADKSPTVQVEEAIADMARDLIDNKKVIGGKPRNLLERIIQFFTKLRNMMDGYGFTTFEDLLDAIRSGEVGRREQGVVRSLRTTEAIEEKMGFLPARYRERITEFGKEPPVPTAKPAVAGQTAADFDEAQLAGAEVRESRRAISDTIEVDGVQRPTMNSEGRPIFDTEEGVRNFWRWFGDSKMVDEQGRPKVYYHGTKNNFDAFKGLSFKDKIKKFFKVMSAEKAGYLPDTLKAKQFGSHFFTDNPELASDYATYRYTEQTVDQSPNVVPVYLRMERPVIIDLHGAREGTITTPDGKQKVVEHGGLKNWMFANRVGYDLAEANKADGFISRNVYDAVKPNDEKAPGDYEIIVTFDPNQAKSAISNIGQFSRKDDRIRYSRKDVQSSKDWAYSPLMKAVESVSPKVTTAQQWSQWLDANAPKLGVSKDEIEFSGIKDFIALKEGKVSKDDVLAYLDQNGVQVTETILGENPGKKGKPKPFTYRRADDGRGWDIIDNNYPEQYPDGLFAGFIRGTEQDAIEEVRIANEDLDAGIYEPSPLSPIKTKYQTHTVPGGKDYRELLLALPAKTKTLYGVSGAVPGEKFESREKAQEYIDQITAVSKNDTGLKIAERLSKYPLKIYEYKDTEKAKFESSHWDKPNVLAHTRIDTRTDANGDPVLFVNEIQSDWGQEGRKQGFEEKAVPTGEITIEKDGNVYTVINNGVAVWSGVDEQKANAQLEVEKAKGLKSVGKIGIARAPFVTDTKSWVALTIKRLLRYAVDNGFKKVAFINGQQAADIFDLSKQIDYIEYEQTEPGKYYIRATDHRGGRPLTEYQQTPEQLEGLVGKEIAQKIVDGVGEKGEDGNKVLRTKDLKVGGEGMKSFYDRIVPQVATDVIRKIGGKNLSYSYIGERSKWTIEENEIGDFVVRKNGFIAGPTRTSREGAEEFIRRQTKDSGLNQLSIEITPEMERNILAGQRLFSRKDSGDKTPITDAVRLAKEKYGDLKIDSEEEFFKHWSKLIKQVGRQLNPTPYGIRVAAQRAIKDMESWIKDNSRYADYYDKDMVAVRDALKEKYGKVTDDDMKAFQLFAGLTSPNTGLKSNISDALALLDLLKSDGNLDRIKLGLSDNNNVVIERSPFQISGNTNGNKARSAKVFDRLVREKGSVSKAVDFLMEPVTDKQLKEFNREMGYKSDPEMGKVKRLVMSATGQDQKIPRMFIFGPKVGAYTMNLTGDRNYTTIDIWESRFIRSYFNGLFKNETGLPVDEFEHDLFTQFGDYFKEEFDKLTGKDWDPASLQAMRWFYIINATNKAGYTGASTNDTISEYTRQQLYTAGKTGEYRRGQSDAKTGRGTRKFSRKEEPAAGQPSAAAGESGLRDRGGIRGGEGLLRDAYRPYQEAGRAGKSLKGLLKRVKVDGRIVEFESFAPAQRLAEEYMKEAGMPYSPPTTYVRVDPARSTKIAEEFGKMQHNPQDPLVQAAYRQMMKETSDQYRKILESGLKVEFIKGDDPYGNPRNAILDVIENNHFWVFPTVDGFGSSELDVSNNPLLEETEFKDANGETMLANDVFRVVHDYFGHIMHGVGFRADGEENAWRAHASMYSPLARRAMTTETRGQNSYVNYGPNGEFNRSASPSETIYADQKVGLLPEWVSVDAYEGALEEAVQKAQKDIEDTGKFAVPLYGADATPEALYVAQNPEMGKKPSDDDMRRYSRRNAPDVSPAAKAIMDRATPVPPDETMGQAILKKMELPPLADMKDRFRQGAIFRYARLERQYRNNPELMAQLADTSAIAAIEMSDHARAFTQRALLYGVPAYENGTTKIKDFVHNGKQYRGLIEVMGMLYSKEHGNLEQLAHAYATAVRGERLNKEGKLSPVNPGELAVLEKEVNRFVNPETGQPIIKEWFDTWQAYNSNIVKYLRDTGIVDQAGADLWMKQADYIPFYREDAEGNLQFPRVFGGLHTAGQFKAVGKSDKALNVDMITAIVGNVDAAIAMGMKNVAQQRIIRDQIKLGLASVLKQGETVGQRNSVSFKIGGKRYTAIIDDPLIYESMLPVSEIPLDGIIGQAVRAPAGLLRELIIRDPGYMIANMFRDTLSSYAITGAEITPVVDTVRGMFSDLTNLENMGVVGGYDLRLDDGGVRKFYDKHAKKMGMVAGLDWTKPWMAIWDGMGRLSTRSEAATRLAVYNDVLARTGNEAEAQYQALSVMNYGRRGSNPLLRALTAVVPFMNARIQGLDKLYQAGRGRTGAKYDKSAQGEVTRNLNNLKNFQRFFFRAALITGITALYYAMVSDDDEYKNASPEVRDNYYIIPLKKGDVAAGEPGLSMRLPIPFEVGILFKVIPERLMATMYGEDTPRDVKQSFWRNMTSTLAINPIPQAVLPVVEMMFNYDTFTGRPVVPAYMENLLPEQQQTFYTNQLAVKLAETETGQKLGISPMKLDHLLQGYFGTLGGYFLQALDSVARENGMVKPETTWYQKPFIKRFFTTANQPGLQNQFYDLKDYTDGITRTINDLEEQGRYDELATFYAKNGHLYEMRSTLNFLNREITALRDQRKMIEQMDIDPESKRELIEQINMQIAATLTSVPMLRQEAFGPRLEEGQ